MVCFVEAHKMVGSKKGNKTQTKELVNKFGKINPSAQLETEKELIHQRKGIEVICELINVLFIRIAFFFFLFFWKSLSVRKHNKEVAVVKKI